MASRRVALLALDGLDHALFTRLRAGGALPRLDALLRGGRVARLRSVHPCVSNVCWASVLTGEPPARHGLFGFVHRAAGAWRLAIPTARDIRVPTLLHRLSTAGRRVCAIGVPGTYPPSSSLNGPVVGDFLAPDLARAVSDPGLVPLLRECGFRLDADVRIAARDPRAFLADARAVVEGESRLVHRLLDREPYDAVIVHVMVLDRAGHALWGALEDRDPALAPGILDLYGTVDRIAGELAERLLSVPGTALVLASDHGFARARASAGVNAWLVREGYLIRDPGATVRDPFRGLKPALTRAYALTPGRVYLNREGREPGGIVRAGPECERLLGKIADGLLAWRGPDGGAVVRAVHRGTDLFRDGAALADAPDLVAEPAEGYDLRGDGEDGALLGPPGVSGRHEAARALAASPEPELVPAGDGAEDLVALGQRLLGLAGL
ncbi:MAG: alkaline phosphatase family protein [Planctomycetales bacterium]|nr:alkaline phosphatase family protein [Planctomycetales bacterium]